ncbi:MAG TPA: hypothetical protein VGF16_18240 [Bryobacteraceae bacterium]|jgi:hypothetical protein
MASLAHPLALCDDKVQLSRMMIHYAAAILSLQTKHSDDLIAGGEGVRNFAEKLEAARMKWENARQAYLFHLREHGC